jgi:hypothetical protein
MRPLIAALVKESVYAADVAAKLTYGDLASEHILQGVGHNAVFQPW